MITYGRDPQPIRLQGVLGAQGELGTRGTRGGKWGIGLQQAKGGHKMGLQGTQGCKRGSLGVQERMQEGAPEVQVILPT